MTPSPRNGFLGGGLGRGAEPPFELAVALTVRKRMPITSQSSMTSTRERSMDEHAVRALVDEVKAGRLSRRRFVRTMIGLGLTAPLAGQILASAGIARAQPKSLEFTPARRGGGGPLKTLWWQAPTLLNPHFATGTKDQDAARIFYEPLAGFDPDGNVVPVLAAELPSIGGGTLAKDFTWV